MILSQEEFFQHRIQICKETASLYDLMSEIGHAPRYQERSAQISCVFMRDHPTGKDDSPSARYYPKGEKSDTEGYYCWVCTPKPLSVISFLQRWEAISFTEALRRLERRYHIKHDVSYEEIEDFTFHEKEIDVSKLVQNCESRLRQDRDVMAMSDYVTWCHRLDEVYLSQTLSDVKSYMSDWRLKTCQTRTPIGP